MKKRFTPLFLVPIFVISLTGCGKQAAKTEAQATETATPVQVVKVVEGTMDQKAGITGTFKPKNTVTIAPKVSAKISKIHVQLGDHVKLGDDLFAMDTTDLANTVKQEQAAYEMAQASLKQSQTNLGNGVEQAQQSLLTAQNTLSQAEHTLSDAKTNEQRVKQLFAAGASSKSELDKEETELANAEIAYKNAQVGVEQAKTSLNHAGQKDAVEVAQASVKQAVVRLQNAQDQLTDATVKSSISGIVSVVNGAAGQMAGPQTTVVTVVQVDPILVKAYLSEEERVGVNVGTKAQIEVPSINKKLEATVTAVSPVVDPQLKAYPVELEIPNPSNELQADMVVTVKFSSQKEEGVKSLIIPFQAVISEGNMKFVYKLNESTVKKVEITTGEETSEQVVVKSGLSVNDQIVFRGQSLLKDGAKVEVQKTQ